MTVLLGGLLLAAAVALAVLEPILSGRRAARDRPGDEHDEGAARRRVALTALRDLEYDRATGKIDRADYESLKIELGREALRHLEGSEGDADARAEGRPEAERASRDLEEEIARARRAIRGGFECPHCDAVDRIGARYCSRCGRALTGAGAGGTAPPEAGTGPGAEA